MGNLYLLVEFKGWPNRSFFRVAETRATPSIILCCDFKRVRAKK